MSSPWTLVALVLALLCVAAAWWPLWRARADGDQPPAEPNAAEPMDPLLERYDRLVRLEFLLPVPAVAGRVALQGATGCAVLTMVMSVDRGATAALGDALLTLLPGLVALSAAWRARTLLRRRIGQARAALRLQLAGTADEREPGPEVEPPPR